MANQKTVYHKRVPDSSCIKPILKKRPTSEGPKDKPKRVSFSVQGGDPRTKSQSELHHAMRDEPPRSHRHSSFISTRTNFQTELRHAMKDDEPPGSHHDVCRAGSVHEGGAGDVVMPSARFEAFGITQNPNNNTENTKSQSGLRHAKKDEPPRSNHDGIESSVGRVGSICEGGTGDAATPASCFEASIHRIRNSDNNTANTSSLFMKASSSNTSKGNKDQTAVSSDCTGGEKGNLMGTLPIDLHPRNGPAGDVAWRGSFEVVDCGKIRRCEGMVAHLSRKVCREAFELSKSIAPFPQFKMLPCSDFYPEVFQVKSPDRNDIALYFYPGAATLGKAQYCGLLRDMVKKDLMLRCYMDNTESLIKKNMDNTELLVFPSSVLQKDSQKLNNKDYFMWGVFRRQKGSTSSCSRDGPGKTII